MSLTPVFTVSLVSAWISFDSAAWIAVSSAGGDADGELELNAGAFDEVEGGAGGGIVFPLIAIATTPAAATTPPIRRLAMKAQRARPTIAAATPMNSADRPTMTRPPDTPPPTSPNRHSRI